MDIETEIEFFSEIFEQSENMFEKNSFGRKRRIMNFLLRSKRNFLSSFVRHNGFRMKFLLSLIFRIGEHKYIARHMIRHFSNFKIMSFLGGERLQLLEIYIILPLISV